MIEVKDLWVGYSRDKPLLKNINCRFEENKIYGMLGESGLGKTTFLRTIAGLEKPISAALNDFVEIAKTLDGTVIQIEGNVASDNTSEAEMILSEQRAETIKKYLIVNGISADRIITIGNGGTKPKLPNYNPDGSLSKEGTDANRRTDIYFKMVE